MKKTTMFSMTPGKAKPGKTTPKPAPVVTGDEAGTARISAVVDAHLHMEFKLSCMSRKINLYARVVEMVSKYVDEAEKLGAALTLDTDDARGVDADTILGLAARKKRMTVPIDEALFTRFKVVCTRRGISMATCVQRLIEADIKANLS